MTSTKLEKKLIPIEINYFETERQYSSDDFRDFADRMDKEMIHSISFTYSEDSWGNSNGAKGLRYETSLELAERQKKIDEINAKDAAAKKKLEEKEKAEYKRLHTKYGPKL